MSSREVSGACDVCKENVNTPIDRQVDGRRADLLKPQLLCEITPLPDNHIYADDDAGDTDVRVLRLRDLRDRFEVQGITRVNNDPPGSDQFSRSSRSRRTGGPTRLDR